MYRSSDGITWEYYWHEAFTNNGDPSVVDFQEHNDLFFMISREDSEATGPTLRTYKKEADNDEWEEVGSGFSSRRYGLMEEFRNRLFLGVWYYTSGSNLYAYDDELNSWNLVNTFSNENIRDFIIFDNAFYIITSNTVSGEDKIYYSTDGEEFSYLQDLPFEPRTYFAPRANSLVFRGNIYCAEYPDEYFNINIQRAESIAPVRADHFKMPRDWKNFSTDTPYSIYAPNPGNALLWSWRYDSDWIPFVYVYENNEIIDLGEDNLGKFCFVGDSNLFTNSAPNANYQSNKVLVTNILNWLFNSERIELLWLGGDWSGSDREGWLNPISSGEWGASQVSSIARSIGFSITRVIRNINGFLANDFSG